MFAPGLTNYKPENAPMEYPKWVHMDGYPSVVAQTPEDEAELLTRPPKDSAPVVEKPAPLIPVVAEGPVPTNILTGENNEREMYLKLAKERGIKVDARWNTNKLRAAVEHAT